MGRSLPASALVLSFLAAGSAVPSAAQASGPSFYTRAVAWDFHDPICDTGESSASTAQCGQTFLQTSPHIEGDATATAGLDTGVLDVTANSQGAFSTGTEGQAKAIATLFDTLTFHNFAPGDNVVINLTAAVSESQGFVGGPPGDVFGDSEGSIGLAVNDQFGHSIGFVNDCEPNFFGNADCTPLNTLGATVTNLGSSYSITSTLSLTAFPVLQLLFTASAVASGDGSGGVIDPISISLPPGVTYTSASGRFLTGAVPEPSTWLELIIGAAISGLILRRRRCALS
jgi:hypothetical protein